MSNAFNFYVYCTTRFLISFYEYVNKKLLSMAMKFPQKIAIQITIANCNLINWKQGFENNRVDKNIASTYATYIRNTF